MSEFITVARGSTFLIPASLLLVMMFNCHPASSLHQGDPVTLYHLLVYCAQPLKSMVCCTCNDAHTILNLPE